MLGVTDLPARRGARRHRQCASGTPGFRAVCGSGRRMPTPPKQRENESIVENRELGIADAVGPDRLPPPLSGRNGASLALRALGEGPHSVNGARTSGRMGHTGRLRRSLVRRCSAWFARASAALLQRASSRSDCTRRSGQRRRLSGASRSGARWLRRSDRRR